MRIPRLLVLGCGMAVGVLMVRPAEAQLIDRTQSPNVSNDGIAKSYEDQIGAGRGDINTFNSSLYIINRDPFRAVRRGRQIFQRKFTRAFGHGPRTGDGMGDINTDLSIGAGLADSCASCHGRPKGGAGVGGDVVTRPDSRDAPHLFGLGLKEMLADEITGELRKIRAEAIAQARRTYRPVTRRLVGKGISYGAITAKPDGTVDTSLVKGVDPDLRVRPLFLHGGTISIREFVVGAFRNEMGLESPDPDTLAASSGQRVVTPVGMVLDGTQDKIEAPPVNSPAQDADGDGVVNEVPVSIVDHMEAYLLNYAKPGHGEENFGTAAGRHLFARVGCTECHVPNLTVERDRRVADLETVFDPARGNPFNRLFGSAVTLITTTQDDSGLPPLKRAALQPFVVRDIFTDFKRHDLGPNFHERNYDGTLQKEFLTTALWGVGTTAPYGHDGRSNNLMDVILRHGGEAQVARNHFAALPRALQSLVVEFLNSLVLFAVDDTSTSLNPANPTVAGYPQFGHGSLRLMALTNNPSDPE